MAVFGYLEERRGRQGAHTELVREGRATTRVLKLALEDALTDNDVLEIQGLVNEITSYERILGARIFGPDGSVAYQSTSLENTPLTDRDTLGRVLHERIAVESQRDF